MNITIVIVGDEILRGKTTDLNGPVIAKSLATIGLEPTTLSVVGDDTEQIRTLLQQASTRSDLIIVTGGLGPNHNDVTLKAVEASGGEEISEIKVKTANTRGYSAHIGKAQIYCLPGSPPETEALLEGRVLVNLSKTQRNGCIASHTLKVHNHEISEALDSLHDPEKGQWLDIHPSETETEVVVRVRAENQKQAKKLLTRLGAEVCTRLGTSVHGPLGQNLAQSASEALRAHGLKIGVVEIATGGRLISQLAQAPQNEEFFVQGLHLSPNYLLEYEVFTKEFHRLLRDNGAADKEVATLAASLIKNQTQADLGLALTGIIGPRGGTVETPVGSVHCALVSDQNTIHAQSRFVSMSAQSARNKAAAWAMSLILNECRKRGG